jgi:hypothetical protein
MFEGKFERTTQEEKACAMAVRGRELSEENPENRKQESK